MHSVTTVRIVSNFAYKQHERDLSGPFGTLFSALTMHLFLFLLLKSPFILPAVTDNISVLENSLEGVRSFHLSNQLRLI